MLKNIKILTWFNFFTDFKLYAPIAILYFAEISGSYALGMSIFSVVMISSAIFEIPTGVFSDRIGRRKTIILGALFAFLAVIFYAIGSFYWILIIGALFEGLARSFYSGNNDALLYDTLLSENYEHKFAEHLGKTSKMFQIALAVSAVLGGIILFNWDFKVIFWLSVIPQFLCLILAFALKEPKIHSERSGNIFVHLRDAYLEFIRNRKLRLLSLSSILGTGFGEASYQFQSAFYATVWPVWAIPFAKVLSNVEAAISFHYSGRIIGRFNVFKVSLLGQFYSRGAVIISALMSNIFSPILYSTTSLFYGVMVVGRNDLMQKEFNKDKRATMGSLDSFAGSILFGIVAISVGFLADKLSPSTAIIIIQLILVINIFIFYKLFKIYKNLQP